MFFSCPVCCCLTWCDCCLNCWIIWHLYWNQQVEEGKCVRLIWPSEMSQTAMGFVYMLIEFFLPLLIILFCYGRIIWMLSKRVKSTFLEQDNNSKRRASHNNTFELAKKNTTITLLIVACFFVICWCQNQVIFFLHNLGYYVDFDSAYYNSTVIAIFVNCTINPFIYLAKYRDYQEALREFMSSQCRKGTRRQSESSVFSLGVAESTSLPEPSVQTFR